MMNTLFDLHDPPPVDTRTDAERESCCSDLVARLRDAADGISYRLCIEIAGPQWLDMLTQRGVAVIVESCGLVRVEN